MCPRSDDESPPTNRESLADGGSVQGMDEEVLYHVIRKAVEDALLGVIGTLLLVGLAFVVVWVGLTVAVGANSVAAVGVGVLIALFGVYLAAATLELIPSVWDLI